MMRRLTSAWLVVFACSSSAPSGNDFPPPVAKDDRGDPASDRLRVTVDPHDPRIGPDDAVVTIVLFTDATALCGFCARVDESLLAIQSRYPADVRIVYKLFGMWRQSQLSDDAAYAAAAQGRLQPFLKQLRDHPDGNAIEQETDPRAKVDEYASKVGLDLTRFDADLTSSAAAQARDRVKAEASIVGVTGVPHAFINGRSFAGAADEAVFDSEVRAAIADATQVVGTGVPRAGVYDELMKRAWKRNPPIPPPETKVPDLPGVVDGHRYAIPIEGDPVIGAPEAGLTLVFATEYSRLVSVARLLQQTGLAVGWDAAPLLSILRERYGNELRIVYKPLVLDDDAKPYAMAACAAAKQGRFADMDQALWKATAKNRIDTPDSIATSIGLDLSRFQADMAACKQTVETETKQLTDLGVRSAPAVFVNGNFIGDFGKIISDLHDGIGTSIDSELAAVQRRIATGTPAKQYYQRWVLEPGTKPQVP